MFTVPMASAIELQSAEALHCYGLKLVAQKNGIIEYSKWPFVWVSAMAKTCFMHLIVMWSSQRR